MSVVAIIGMQWGDEAKGKVVDLLSERADVVARFQGGPNAGHTVVIGDDTFILHHIPSGILRENTVCVVGDGMIIDLSGLIDEVDQLRGKGIKVNENLVISEGAHLIMPYHRLLDGACEKLRGELKIGTTKKGIGPTYADKVAYKGIRVCDLMNEDVFSRKLRFNLEEKNFLFKNYFNMAELSFEDVYREFMRLKERVSPHVGNTRALLREAIEGGKNVLAEGAQGTMLDVDHGSYPYVTASNSSVAGIGGGLGIPPQRIDVVVGVAKAYTTRVGEGPLPTEDRGGLCETLRNRGSEFGATTGRPRRCGDLDLVVLRHSCWVNGVDRLAVTKLDVLDSLKRIRICTAYEFRGKSLRHMPYSAEMLSECKPIYEEVSGWESDTSGVNRFDELPEGARAYLELISERLGVSISIVGTGPGRGDAIVAERLL